MGLPTSPAWFQEDTKKMFGDQAHRVLVYIDDIIIFTATFEEHIIAIRLVLGRLIEFNMKASRPKCEFARTELTYLGHVVNSQGIATDLHEFALFLRTIKECTFYASALDEPKRVQNLCLSLIHI